MTKTLEKDLQNLFNAYNSHLDNPVGTYPNDVPLTLARGTSDDIYKALAAISYLGSIAGFGNNVVIATGLSDFSRWPEIEECAQELVPILDALVLAFEPRATHYSYIDQNDGRVTSHAANPTLLLAGPEEIDLYFPTVRERLEAKRWLQDLFIRMNMNTSIIEKTFP